MNKAGPLVFVAVCGAAVGWLALQEREGVTPSPAPSTEIAAAESQGGGLPDAGIEEVLLGDDIEPSDAGGTMPDGSKVPELDDAPKAVRFGVVLVEYSGAQGAKPSARSHEDAEKLAKELAELAKSDFAAAVKKGDEGSTQDAGRMFRGILEAYPEYVLFSLEEGAVSEAIDTPRGFWILKRIE